MFIWCLPIAEETDYVSIPPTLATFGERETSIRITVQIRDDDVLEGEELMFVRAELVGDPPGVTLEEDTATVIIRNDDR